MKLRSWRLKDASALVRISRHNMEEAPSGYLIGDTLEHARELITHYRLLPESRGHIYAIWNHLHIIGYIQLIQLHETRFEVGYYMDESMRNHGYMSKALHRLLQKTQQNVAIQEVQARVLKHNIASRKVLKHNNFVLYAVWDDLLCYRLTMSTPSSKDNPLKKLLHVK